MALDLLETGIFTVAEAAQLIGTSEQRVRGWIAGYPRRAAPILDNELGWIDGKLAFSFTNLMEIRFLAFFAGAGVNVRRIRSIALDARELLKHPHPFATDIVFRTDGRMIFAEIGEKNGLPRLFELKSKNYEMKDIILESLKEDVVYDPKGLARVWYPRPGTAPNVIVHPKLAFGRPVLRKSRVPTQTLDHAVRAEGNVRIVARWFEIAEREVREAVAFEAELRKAA